MPWPAEPLSVGIQDDELVVWALIDPDFHPPGKSHGARLFVVANTGQEIDGVPKSARFLGTATTSNGIVWHVWDGNAGAAA